MGSSAAGAATGATGVSAGTAASTGAVRLGDSSRARLRASSSPTRAAVLVEAARRRLHL